MKKILFVLLAFIFLMNSTGCVSVSTLQTPKILENDEKLIGLGLTTHFENDELAAIPELYVRWAAFKSFDMGINMTGVPFAVGIIGWDIKYQALNIDSTFYVAFDLGISYSSLDEHGSAIGYYPAIYLGTERIFGGAKLIIADVDYEFFGKHEGTGQLPEFFLGASIGDKWRVMPIVNLLYSEDFKESLFLLSLGFEYRF